MIRGLAAGTGFILSALPALAGAATALAIGPGSTVEGDAGNTPLTFFIARTGDLTNPVNVGVFTLQTGQAAAGVDYHELPFDNRVVLPAGVASAVFNVLVVGDIAPEFTESFTLALASPYEVDGAPRTLAAAVAFPVALPTGASSHVTADIDGDRRRDVLIAAGGQRLVILRNTTAGGGVSFAVPSVVNLGADVADVAVADFDGDGQVDVAVAHVNADEIRVLRNRSVPGTISLSAAVPFAGGAGPHVLAVGDYDGDASPDVFAANILDATVSVFVNTSVAGSLSFDSLLSSAGGSSPTDIAVADFDGDGLPEVVTAHSNGQVFVRRNLCCGGAPYDSAQLVFSGATAVVTGDVDGDGLADLVTNGSDEVRLLRNTSTAGSVSFAAVQPFPAAGMLIDVALADLDQDGLPEIVAANPDDDVVFVLANDSAPGAPAFLAAQPHAMGASPFRVAGGDLDGDGFADVVSLNQLADGSVSLLRNKGTDVAIDIGLAEAYIFNDDAFPRGSSSMTPAALLGLLALLLLRRRRS